MKRLRHAFPLLSLLLALIPALPSHATTLLSPTACYASLSATAPCVGQTGCDSTTYFTVNSFSTGVSAQQTSATTSQVFLQNFTVLKVVDQFSTTLLMNSLLATEIPFVSVICIETIGNKPFPFLQYQLQNVLVSSVSDGSSGKTGALPVESVSFNPQQISVTVSDPTPSATVNARSAYIYNQVTGRVQTR